MAIFGKKKIEYPRFPEGDFEAVLKCSICNGEQVICARNRNTDEIQELMLIRRPGDLEDYCAANGLKSGEIRKIY